MEKEKNKILVVDDEPEIVKVLKNFLSLKGYEVNSAFSGEEALDSFEKEKADLILLDMRMPGISGAEVARILKGKYPDLKIIVLTGYANEIQELSKLSKDNLVERVCIKPISLEALYNKLLDVFGQKQPLDLKSKQGIKARVLLLKAKLLFIENSLESYYFLNRSFRALSQKGEDYELEAASNEEEIIRKTIIFNPDILVVNSSFFGQGDKNVFSKILENTPTLKETIVYDINDFSNTGLEKLIKSVETACVKHGLLEIKWIEI